MVNDAIRRFGNESDVLSLEIPSSALLTNNGKKFIVVGGGSFWVSSVAGRRRRGRVLVGIHCMEASARP